MRKSAEPKYLSHLFLKSGTDTWKLVIALPICTFILTVAIAALAIVLQRRFGSMSHSQMKDAAISLGFGLAAIVMVYLSVWIFHFLYLTPKHLVEDAVVKKDAALKEFDLEKASLRAQLAELEQKLQRQRREAVKEVVDKAIRIIEKNPVLRKYPLRALLEAGVGDLETEDQFLEACEAIIQHRIHDPLMGLRDLWPNHPPKWLAAIKLANQKQVDVSQ